MKQFFALIFTVLTGMVASTINNGSFFWTFMDALFFPIAWCKWLICHDVTLAVLKQTFGWFIN